MKALSNVLLLMLLFAGLAATARPEQSSSKIDWDQFRAASPVLERTVEQLSKEGYVVDFQRGQTRDFGDLFVVAFLPVTNGRLAPDAEHGTLGLIVVFTRVPAPTTLVVSQVVRVEYAKNVYTKNFEINGKEETLKGSQLVTDEEHLMLQLVVDNEGEVRQKIDRLLIQTGEKLNLSCFDSALAGVKERCIKYKAKSNPDWLRCVVAGFLWAHQACGNYHKG
ncbi:MAG TPA: hypothetical protein VNY74_14460 [Edaphobacter sp.]|nr:hypothetical protein [Edaphobacter sp.]